MVICITKNKTHGKKLKIAKAAKKASPAPRWIDLKVFGLQRARFRSTKRFANKKRGGLQI